MFHLFSKHIHFYRKCNSYVRLCSIIMPMNYSWIPFSYNQVHSTKLDADSFWVKANEEALASEEIFKGLIENFAAKAPSTLICTTFFNTDILI